MTVQNCFKHAGFLVCTGDAEDVSDTIGQACDSLLTKVLEWQSSTESISFTGFRYTDSAVETSPDMSDEAIIT